MQRIGRLKKRYPDHNDPEPDMINETSEFVE